MFARIIFQYKVCLSYASSLIHSMNIASRFKSDTFHSHMITFTNLIPHIIISICAAISAGWFQAGSESVRTCHCLQPTQNIRLQGWPGKIRN